MHHPPGSLAYEAYSRSVRPPELPGVIRSRPGTNSRVRSRVAWECVAITVAGESFRLADEAALRKSDLI